MGLWLAALMVSVCCTFLWCYCPWLQGCTSVIGENSAIRTSHSVDIHWTDSWYLPPPFLTVRTNEAEDQSSRGRESLFPSRAPSPNLLSQEAWYCLICWVPFVTALLLRGAFQITSSLLWRLSPRVLWPLLMEVGSNPVLRAGICSSQYPQGLEEHLARDRALN